MNERTTAGELCAACGAAADAGAAVCAVCGEPLLPPLAGDAAAPFPRIPDGGLAEAMPAWLREAPLPAAAAQSIDNDPATFLAVDDLPAWLRSLAGGAPSGEDAAASGESAPPAVAGRGAPLHLPPAPPEESARQSAAPPAAAAAAAENADAAGPGIPWWFSPLLCAIALAVAAALWYAATGG